MQYYTLIYRYAGKGSNTWVHHFTSLDVQLGSIFLREPCSTDLAWPPMMRTSKDGPWERRYEGARNWFGTFSFVLRWAVILDPNGRVVMDWRRRKETVTYRRFELPKEILG